MRERTRVRLFLAAAAVVALLFAAACCTLPPFGGEWHPYGDRAVTAAFLHRTANAVASVNFDQRALDSLGEDSILFVAVLGAAVLLRRTPQERSVRPPSARTPDGVRRFGLLLLPVAVLTGLYLATHGHLSPGGGFQGGVVLATALHLLYIAADYRALERIRPLAVSETADAAGTAVYVLTGLLPLLAGAAALTNVLPHGTFGELLSGGTVFLFNAAVGLDVVCGVVVLLARFLDQATETEQVSGRSTA